MLDLAFLVIGIYVFIKANNGEYKETACNIALVVGILAGLTGCIVAISKWDGVFATLNMIVMLMAFGLRFMARHLVKLYHDRELEREEALQREIYLHSRFDNLNQKPVYTDDTFDDEELRFGKGGYTDPKL